MPRHPSIEARQAHAARITAVALALALAVTFCLLATAHPAQAFPALATPDGKTSAQLSDDGQDYGWLYRQGDIWYAVEDYPTTHPFEDYAKVAYGQLPGDEMRYYLAKDFLMPDGVTLSMSSAPMKDLTPLACLYPDGTLIYQRGASVDLDAIIRSGSLDVRRCAWHSITQAYRTGAREIVLDADTLGCWHSPDNPENPKREFLWDMGSLFSGMEDVRSIEGLPTLWTGRMTSMARAFAGCASLEELDLSGFETFAHEDFDGCEDFTGMFDGCLSLTHLEFGAGWDQSRADEAKRATFPLAMTRDADGALFQAGDVIPDGAAAYTVHGRENLAHAKLSLSWEGTSAAAGKTLACEYTGSAIEPQVTVSLGGRTLERGTDYQVEYRNNVEDGTARVLVSGVGAYYGRLAATFRIQDTGAWAFLFQNGTLCLKAGHSRPAGTIVSASQPLLATWRWFDAATAQPGASVPWAKQAAKVKKVVIDKSFGTFKPASAAGWFAGCTALASIQGLGNIDGTRIASVARMFQGCTKLAELDLSGLRTPQATDFSKLASGCSKLELLDLGSLDASKAKAAAGFYAGCPSLKAIRTASGFKNAKTGLAFAKTAYQVAPSYVKRAAGVPLPSGAGEYRLAQVPMQSTTITLPKRAYDCTGKAIKPAVEVRLGGVLLKRGVDYTLSYADNVYPGTAKVTVTGKGAFTGGVVANFTVKSAITKAGDQVRYKNEQAEFQMVVAGIRKTDGHITSATVKVTGITVTSKKTARLVIPSTCTIGGVKVTVTAVSSKLSGKFRNVKTIVVGATVVKIGAKAFAKAANATTLVVKSKRLADVKNCLKGSSISKVQVKVSLSKSKQKKYRTWFTKKAGKSGVRYTYG